MVQTFAANGYNVGLMDVDTRGLDEMCGALQNNSALLPIAGDVSSPEDAQQAVAKTLDKFGGLDVLVNNAGIEIAGTAADLTIEKWDRLLGVNLRGAFLMSKAALPHLKSGGSIINISSVHAFTGYPGCAAYDSSKAGLLGLTRAMAIDHGAAGIRVNAICPGYILTPLMESWLAKVEDREATLARVRSVHPLGRIGEPRDIAEAALFLASDKASFITGATFVIDGGMTLSGK
jgi:meso-butanediol dehydrogenase/(S,S)-butanediol dehydrogenase/diacetyl reductase